MYKTVYQFDDHKGNYSKTGFPSDMNCDGRNVCEMGPCSSKYHMLQVYIQSTPLVTEKTLQQTALR